jgi:hypothetical protein
MKLFPYSIFFILVFCTCTTSKESYESVEKNQDFRDAILNENNGDYVLLRNGYTYYEEANSESKEGNIILVHGFSRTHKFNLWVFCFTTL